VLDITIVNAISIPIRSILDEALSCKNVSREFQRNQGPVALLQLLIKPCFDLLDAALSAVVVFSIWIFATRKTCSLALLDSQPMYFAIFLFITEVFG